MGYVDDLFRLVFVLVLCGCIIPARVDRRGCVDSPLLQFGGIGSNVAQCREE